MEEKVRVLYVTQNITPYLKESPMGKIGRFLPQGIQERGMEIRTFMPRFGSINERRNQLHEVIRLSGMNLIIDDSDHPLIIKVASIQAARMQVYFIDNEDFFHRKFVFHDKGGKFFKDNDERAIFFVRGVLETVKKLGWPPDIIHCHGWMASLLPAYVRKVYHENPVFSESKIVYSLYDDGFADKLNAGMASKAFFEGLGKKDLPHLEGTPGHAELLKTAIDYSDAIIYGGEGIDPAISQYAEASGLPVLPIQGEEEYIEAYAGFYDNILGR